MTLIRHQGETQVAFVARMLDEHGEVRVYDLLWDSRYDDGGKTAISRTATHIHTLRHDRGWDIATVEEGGSVATYRLISRPGQAPAWARGWECVACHSHPDSEPNELLGGMGFAICGTCGERKHFRRAA